MAEVSSRLRWGRLLVCVAAGILIVSRPAPAGLTPEAWRVFAVFISVVLGFLLRPLDMAPTVLLGLLALILSGTVELKTAVSSGFGDATVWLVVAAFLIADAVEQTGLGRRIALLLLRALGRSLLGLGYAIAASELVLAPFIPSNTARGGGIISPIVHGLARTLGSHPRESPVLGGAYLVQTGAHANLVTSSMFLTAMAGNALILPGARDHLGIDFDYGYWLAGSCVPGVASLLLVPLLVRVLERPAPIDVAAVKARVAAELGAIGPWRRVEIKLSVLLLALLVLWTAGKPIEKALGLRLETTTVALLGVALLVVLGIRSWQDLASSWRAWDALLWLGGFVALAESLKSTGFTSWFAERMREVISGWGGLECALALGLVYFASMYLFSQLTAHAAALSAAFFAVAASTGAPPLLTVAIIAYFTCLCGATTPWSTGPVIIYFALDYVPAGRWMRNGLAIAVCQIVIWLGIGLAWWRWLGWW